MTRSSNLLVASLSAPLAAESGRSAPCLGLALVAAGVFWAGFGSTVALLLS